MISAIEQNTGRVLKAGGFIKSEQSTLLDAWHFLRRRRQRAEQPES